MCVCVRVCVCACVSLYESCCIISLSCVPQTELGFVSLCCFFVFFPMMVKNGMALQVFREKTRKMLKNLKPVVKTRIERYNDVTCQYDTNDD